MSVIEISHLTKDYGHARGVFDVNINIDKGECYGFLGPNGAGKTTTIRHLMGFSKPQLGYTAINGLDSWKNSSKLQNTIGYLPGEVTLPLGLKGTAFLKMMESLRGVKKDDYLQMLLKRFDLDANISIKQMSLGVKRKLAIVTAFMHDPDILILDEPTSGLDPIGQQVFIDFIKEEKGRGKTIFMSSHIFREVDATCNRIAIIRDGQIASEFDSNTLKESHDKIYRIVFKDEESYRKFINLPLNFTSLNGKKLRVRIQVKQDMVRSLVEMLAEYEVADFTEIQFTLEDYFMSFYENNHCEGAK